MKNLFLSLFFIFSFSIFLYADVKVYKGKQVNQDSCILSITKNIVYNNDKKEIGFIQSNCLFQNTDFTNSKILYNYNRNNNIVLYGNSSASGDILFIIENDLIYQGNNRFTANAVFYLKDCHIYKKEIKKELLYTFEGDFHPLLLPFLFPEIKKEIKIQPKEINYESSKNQKRKIGTQKKPIKTQNKSVR